MRLTTLACGTVGPDLKHVTTRRADPTPLRRRTHSSPLRSRPRVARLIPLAELSPGALGAWRELAADSAEPNPFFEPECVLPAVRYLGEPDAALLAVVDHGSEWLACMPVLPRLARWPARWPALAGWRHRYAFLGTPLVRRTAVERGTERLLAGAFRTSRFGIIALPWLGAGGPVASGLLGALRSHGGSPVVERSFRRAIVTRSAVADGLEGGISPRHRRDLRRSARRLSEALGGSLELHDRTEEAAGVEAFMDLEASGWKGELGTAMRSRDADAQFFRELCDGFRATGRLQMLELGVGDRTVSYKCNLLAGDAVFCFKIAHDETCGRFRPGLQLELRMLELFRDHMSQTWMDSCADPDSPLFEHLWPERRSIGSYVVVDEHHSAVAAIGHSLGHLSTHGER